MLSLPSRGALRENWRFSASSSAMSSFRKRPRRRQHACPVALSRPPRRIIFAKISVTPETDPPAEKAGRKKRGAALALGQRAAAGETEKEAKACRSVTDAAALPASRLALFRPLAGRLAGNNTVCVTCELILRVHQDRANGLTAQRQATRRGPRENKLWLSQTLSNSNSPSPPAFLSSCSRHHEGLRSVRAGATG